MVGENVFPILDIIEHIWKVISFSIFQILVKSIPCGEKSKYLSPFPTRWDSDARIPNYGSLIPWKKCLKINTLYYITKKPWTCYSDHRCFPCKWPFFYNISFENKKNLYVVSTDAIMLDISNTCIRNFPHVLRIGSIKMNCLRLHG